MIVLHKRARNSYLTVKITINEFSIYKNFLIEIHFVSNLHYAINCNYSFIRIDINYLTIWCNLRRKIQKTIPLLKESNMSKIKLKTIRPHKISLTKQIFKKTQLKILMLKQVNHSQVRRIKKNQKKWRISKTNNKKNSKKPKINRAKIKNHLKNKLKKKERKNRRKR